MPCPEIKGPSIQAGRCIIKIIIIFCSLLDRKSRKRCVNRQRAEPSRSAMPAETRCGFKQRQPVSQPCRNLVGCGSRHGGIRANTTMACEKKPVLPQPASPQATPEHQHGMSGVSRSPACSMVMDALHPSLSLSSPFSGPLSRIPPAAATNARTPAQQICRPPAASQQLGGQLARASPPAHAAAAGSDLIDPGGGSAAPPVTCMLVGCALHAFLCSATAVFLCCSFPP